MELESNQFDGNTCEDNEDLPEGNTFENIGQDSEESVPEEVEGNKVDSHIFISAEHFYNENNQDMSYIFSAAFGVVD